MKQMLICLIFSLLLVGCNNRAKEKEGERECQTRMTARDSISRAIETYMERYSSSQYRDVYKNFMQDFFGPGHILADTAAAGRYLRSELAEDGPFDGPDYEPTGYRGNFFRVNLSLVKSGKLPYNLFFKCFVESVQGITPPAGEVWTKTWSLIDSVIVEKGLRFPDEDVDRKELAKQFSEGNYIAHHSRRFNDSVHFHYRIISRDLMKKEILPYLAPDHITDSDALKE